VLPDTEDSGDMEAETDSDMELPDTATTGGTNEVAWTHCNDALVAAMDMWDALPGDRCAFNDVCGVYFFGYVYCVDGRLRINCGDDPDTDSPDAFTEPNQLCPIE
jgi:hypothetical protein